MTEEIKPSPEAEEAIHQRARRFLDILGPDCAESLAEAMLVYAQERRKRAEHRMSFVTTEGRKWAVSVRREDGYGQ